MAQPTVVINILFPGKDQERGKEEWSEIDPAKEASVDIRH